MSEAASLNKLKGIATRIIKLKEVKKDIAEQEKELYIEAGNEGYDKAALKKVIAEIDKNPSDISEFEEVVQIYRDAIR